MKTYTIYYLRKMTDMPIAVFKEESSRARADVGWAGEEDTSDGQESDGGDREEGDINRASAAGVP